ncbi:MAG: LamB/YcsF family protein [Pyrinomonadaceae bacterium]|nr:LamB/YcsF family protein [Pyrinomonadaceae bacterium]
MQTVNNSIDLNCDMGESFGSWKMGRDAEILPLVSSINVACGFHAGDPATMFEIVSLADELDVSIGAHPSYPDLQGFGRRDMNLSPKEVYEAVAYQISALSGICAIQGTKLRHVKPHGALYNRSARDSAVANAVATAVLDFDNSLILYGLSGSLSISEAKEIGLETASEVFADRTYSSDGSLTPRTETGALISKSDLALDQVVSIVENGTVTAADGSRVELESDTVCIHGDGPHALKFAEAIRSGLDTRGIEVSSEF